MSADSATLAHAAESADRIVQRLVIFGRLLREAGVSRGEGGTMDALRSLKVIDITDRDQFYQALQSNFVSGPDDIATFDEIFRRFWQPRSDSAGRDPVPDRPSPLSVTDPRQPDVSDRDDRRGGDEGAPRRSQSQAEAADPGDSHNEDEVLDGRRLTQLLEDEDGGVAADDKSWQAAYSPLETLASQDFGRMSPAELRQVIALVRRLRPRLLTLPTRRYKQADGSSARLDFRRSIRRSLSQGDMLELAWRKRRTEKARIVVLCDVSRSMERYSLLLLHFIYVLASQVHGTEAFTFSTRLTRITGELQGPSPDVVLDRLMAREAAWSSGTAIGRCLSEFNSTWAERLLDGRTVTVVLSDGWDRGEAGLLREQVAQIKRRSRTLIWLNPMMSDKQYAPLCTGMRAALPYIDFLLPCHNISSLQAFADRLIRQ